MKVLLLDFVSSTHMVNFCVEEENSIFISSIFFDSDFAISFHAVNMKISFFLEINLWKFYVAHLRKFALKPIINFHLNGTWRWILNSGRYFNDWIIGCGWMGGWWVLPSIMNRVFIRKPQWNLLRGFRMKILCPN